VSSFHILQADLSDPQQQQATLAMTRAYARNPVGNGADLADDVQAHLIERLRSGGLWYMEF
jgi:hypothetical protein